MFCGRFPCEHVFLESFSPKMIYYKQGEWDLVATYGSAGSYGARFGETPPGLDLCKKTNFKKSRDPPVSVFCLNPFLFLKS